MAKKIIKKKTKDKKIKKKWYPIIAPVEFRNEEIGESYVVAPEDLMGKTIKINLMTLTRDMKKQNTQVILKIDEIKENKAKTSTQGYTMIPAHLKRIIKRAKSIVEDSFTLETKDAVKIRIKPLVLVKSTTTKSVQSDLRSETKKILTESVKKSNFKDVLKDVFTHATQKGLKNNLKKIHPVSSCIIKTVKRI